MKEFERMYSSKLVELNVINIHKNLTVQQRYKRVFARLCV